MQLGWIDFSKNERNKVLSVIHSLDEPGTLDELGLGAIRDGFSDYFFPGTSTVQTRAKYFFIVPYLLKDAGRGIYGSDPNVILKRINDEERSCRDILLKSSSDGIIGGTIPNSWVLRSPMDIYWNGIKRLGIFKENLSVKEYLIQCTLQRNKKSQEYGNKETTEEYVKDDADAGDLTSFSFWSLGNTYRKNWKKDLTIELLPQEAVHLKTQIIVNQKKSLFAYLLENNVDVGKYESFSALSADLGSAVGTELEQMIKLANGFNDLAALITTRYNLIVSCGKNEQAIDRWSMYSRDIRRRCGVNIREIYNRLKIRNPKLITFLLKVQEEFTTGRIDKVDELIIRREESIKDKSRAKTKHAGEYPAQQWIGAFTYDYRFTPAKRIIIDIMKAEVSADV